MTMTGADGTWTLVLDSAQAEAQQDGAALPPLDLALAPGELALIDAPDPMHSAAFGNLCAGLAPLVAGRVRFMDRDWATLPEDSAAALRGRMGRVFAGGSWLPHLSVADNVLLPQLHHTRASEQALRERAAMLAQGFGLPGLPLVRPRDLSPAELARAACVRAFLGEPALLLLETPLGDRLVRDLAPPLLDALAGARARGAACLWLTRSSLVWEDRSFPTTYRLHLSDRGLTRASPRHRAETAAAAA
jgi:phospholipid/cholesterol/gamma-HCH transport system ATP-binding protein